MKASVIVTAWNEPPNKFIKCLDGIHLSKEFVKEIVVLINKYEEYPKITKELLDLISTNSFITRWASFSQNIGIARVWNIGVHMCEGNVCIILNGDCILGEGAIKKLIEPLANEHIGIVGIGGVKDGQKVNKQGLCENVHGTCIAFRKEIYEKVGGVDNEFSPLCDEVELCARIWKNGYGAYIVEGIDYTHKCNISERPQQDILYFGRQVNRTELDKKNNEYKLSLPWLGRVSYKEKNKLQKIIS